MNYDAMARAASRRRAQGEPVPWSAPPVRSAPVAILPSQLPPAPQRDKPIGPGILGAAAGGETAPGLLTPAQIQAFLAGTGDLTRGHSGMFLSRFGKPFANYAYGMQHNPANYTQAGTHIAPGGRLDYDPDYFARVDAAAYQALLQRIVDSFQAGGVPPTPGHFVQDPKFGVWPSGVAGSPR